MALAWQRSGTRVEGSSPRVALLQHYAEREAPPRRVGSSRRFNIHGSRAGCGATPEMESHPVVRPLGIGAVLTIIVAAGIAWIERAAAVASAARAAEARDRATKHSQQVLQSL